MKKVLLIISIGILIFIIGKPASAQNVGETTSWSGEWQGRKLTVIVVARGHRFEEAIRKTEPWWKWGNTTTDAYLFFWSEDQLVDLILDFSIDGSKQKASIYVPYFAEDRLGLQVGDGDYSIGANMEPAYIVWAENGESWIKDGKPNFDLEGMEGEPGNYYLKWRISVAGNGNGEPISVTRTLTDDPDPYLGIPRFQAALREDPSVPYQLDEPLMPSWPYLIFGEKEGHYGKIQPILFELEKRSLTANWAGFHIAGMYQINSLAYPPKTDFESPFAFYRFDQQAGLYPNLVIRTDLWPEADKFGPPVANTHRVAIRMTWTSEISDLWRYSLTMAGNHRIENLVSFGDDDVNVMPYRDYPGWVLGNEWKAVTLVEAINGEPGSEGIYDYSVEDNWPVTYWINGVDTTIPGHFEAPFLDYPTIDPKRLKEGFRGEYSLIYNRQPSLYYSSIDKRLHLMYAQGGIWNLGNRQILRMKNLDGGAYINGWIREELTADLFLNTKTPRPTKPGVIKEQLYLLGGDVFYSNNKVVDILAQEIQPSLGVVNPPQDGSSWHEFLRKEKLFAENMQDPENLRIWLRYFSGPRMTIYGAKIANVRATKRGYRYELWLQPGFRISGETLIPIASIRPGKYIVTVEGDTVVEFLTPSKLSASYEIPELTSLQHGNVRVSIRNEGNQDEPNAQVSIFAAPESGEAIEIYTGNITVYGKDETLIDIDWAPPWEGQWRLFPEIETAKGEVIVLTKKTFAVDSAPQQSKDLLIGLSINQMYAAGILLVLFLLGSAGAAIVWRQTAVTIQRQR